MRTQNKQIDNDQRQRVDALRDTDSSYYDSALELAESENTFRNKLREILGASLTPAMEQELANAFSDETLLKIEAKKMRLKDPLTELRSKGAFLSEVPKILSLEIREEKKTSMLAIDFDHFKKVNDEHGHSAGDIALKTLAQTIKDCLRESDFAFRYGGEEFAILLPNTDIEAATKIAEKIRRTVAETTIKIKCQSSQDIELKKTISVGVAKLRQVSNWKTLAKTKPKELTISLWDLADKALMRAKNSGRNRVEVYDLDKK